jgi:hypothetical protein
VAAAWCVVVLPAPSRASDTAHVDLVVGTILSPQNLTRDQDVPLGTTIQAGPDGLVMLSQSWPSGIEGYDCEWVAVVGYGGQYEVRDEARPDECPVTRPGTPPTPGQPISMSGVRYASAKTDDMTNVPEVVKTSQADWAPFVSSVYQQASSPQPPPPPPSAGMGPLEYDRSYSGADYRDASVSSATECAAICANEAQCVAMTFIPDQSRCWLKSSLPPAQAAPGMISAVKPPASMGGFEYDRSYSGADYRSAVVSSAAACSAICAGEPQCRAMTFIVDQSRCWLKSSVPPTQPAGGMISAIKRSN